MLIDIIALVLLVMALFKGLRKGLIIALFSFIAFFIGLAAALKLSSAVADYIGSNINISQRWLPVLAFIVVFFIVVLLVRLGAKMLEKVVQVAMLGWVNSIGGVIFYFFIYIFIFSILLFYAIQLHLIRQETINSSVTCSYIQPLAPKMMDLMGSVIPFFRNMFDRLLHFFQNISDKKPPQYSFLLIDGDIVFLI